MIVYIAGPYRGDVQKNIASARKVAKEVWESGNVALCPHLNTAHFELDCSCCDQIYINGDLDLLARCDAIVMCPGWEQSKGSLGEHAYASERGIPIYIYPDMPDKHVTEKRAPDQCSAFIDAIMKMYRTHLRKNADYSPANILGTGDLGLVTRLWDKIARLMNLSGFKLSLEKSTYEKPLTPSNEAIDDTFEDLAVYGVIGMLLRKGMWGR